MVAPANNSVNVVADALSLYDFGGGRKTPEEEEMEEEEEAPTHINTKRSLQFLVISVDKLSAKYTGDGQHANDVGAFQGNRPAPVRRILYYFEIYIKDRGNKGTISIGFTDEHFKTSRQPGWDPNTYGYHGDDGYLYHGHGRGDPFGPTFHTGDTVGAGINYASQEFFFTVNGKLVGSRHKDVKCPLYPSVGLHSPNERVDINFGQNPFVFNIEALAQEEREKLQGEIETLHLPFSISHSVVRSYLLHYGYQETLQAFDAASGSMVPPVILTTQENGDKMLEEECYALEHRRKLRQLIRNGEINGALANLETWYPHLLKDETLMIKFLLDCQQFIEYIKAGSLEAAVIHAQENLASLLGISLYQSLLQDCIALLAYEHPRESPVGHLLMLGQREAVADAVNSAILATDPALSSSRRSPQSSLEKLLRQLTACHIERWLLNGGQGEACRLHRLLRGKEGPW